MKRSIFHHRRHSDEVNLNNDIIMTPPALNTMMHADDPHPHHHHTTGTHHHRSHSHQNHHRPRHNQRRQIFPRTNYDGHHTQQQQPHQHQNYVVAESSHSEVPHHHTTSATMLPQHHHRHHRQQRSLFVVGSKDNPRNSDTLALMESTTIEFLHLMETDSLLFSPDNPPPSKVPCFHKSEVVVDGILGMGEFGIVMKVTGINRTSTTRVVAGTTPTEEGRRQEEPPSMTEKDTTIASADGEQEITSTSSFLRMKQKCQSCTALTCLHDDWLDESTRSTAAVPATSATAIIAPTTMIDDDEDDGKWFEQLRLSTNNFTNLAIKQLRKDLYPKKKIEASKDLAREAKFLASLHHPNIVGLRGLVSIPGGPDFGIIIDKLSLTLDEQTKIWKRQCLDSSQFIFPWQSQQRIAEFQRILLERVASLRDVARAIRYLHQKMILFRDLKPENCGQSSQSTEDKVFRIYDFGLAKELKPIDCLSSSLRSNDENDIDEYPRNLQILSKIVDDDSSLLYRATGLTGTLRIMAPEVIQCQPYGFKADIYSFGIVMYEVFAGERCQLTAAEICKGSRPSIPPHMSHPFNDLLVDCWSETITKRPSIETICKQLELEYDRLRVVSSATAPSSKSSSSSSITATTATSMSSSSSPPVAQQQQ